MLDSCTKKGTLAMATKTNTSKLELGKRTVKTNVKVGRSE